VNAQLLSFDGVNLSSNRLLRPFVQNLPEEFVKRHYFRHCMWFVLLTGLTFVPIVCNAQVKDNDTTRRELRNFDSYLDKHQDVRADLEKNPNLINDPAYLNKHPHLKQFLEHHPNTREELRENPRAFMQRENGFEKREDRAADQKSDITKSELRNWDEYLDKHPDVQRDLNKNPNLINDPAYVNKHPHLKDFLEDHPNTREELKENPKAFMHREKTYEKTEHQQQHHRK
jgi:hypothetical protein